MWGNTNKAISLCCGHCSIHVTAAESRDGFSGCGRNTTGTQNYVPYMNNTKCLWNVRFFFFLIYFRICSPTNVFLIHTGQPCCSLISHSFTLCFLYFNMLSHMPLSAARDGLFLHLANKNVNSLQFNELKPCHELEVFPSSPASPSKRFNWSLSKYLNFFKGNIAKKAKWLSFYLHTYYLLNMEMSWDSLTDRQSYCHFSATRICLVFLISKNSKKKKKKVRFCFAKMCVCCLKHS